MKHKHPPPETVWVVYVNQSYKQFSKKEGTMFKKLSVVFACLLLLAVSPVMAQVDYCEGNFDCDQDVDGSDASLFKTDFGRSAFSDPVLNAPPLHKCWKPGLRIWKHYWPM